MRCRALRKGQLQKPSRGVDPAAAAARPPKRKATRPRRVVREDEDKGGSGGKRLRATVFLDKPALSLRDLLEEPPSPREPLRKP